MTAKPSFAEYLGKLAETAATGDAREESFYPALQALLQQFAEGTGRSNVRVMVMPRPTEAGNPDFRVWDGTARIIGYIEAKPPSVDLYRVEGSEQLQRYLATFPNLLLTNFAEFWLYRNGQRVAAAQLARPFVLARLRTRPPVEDAEGTGALLDRFLQFSLPRPLSAKDLALELAKRTRFLRDMVLQQLTTEQAEGDGRLSGFYEAFERFLIRGLTPEQFADLYAQTVAYGLFAARTRAGNGFNRRLAFDHIPHTIGVLRDLFRYISLEDLAPEVAWIVDDMAEVLAISDVSDMLARYYREGRGSDPIVHFYETFLAHYDPEERERRGVYYTPDPVVSYIVRSLNALLKEKFGKADGLASSDVTLLDPAAGTMTFVARATETAAQEWMRRYGSGGRQAFIRNHVLRHFFAFELMMAPYAVGHLKMAFFLEQLGYRLAEDERVLFYLTNTLDMTEVEDSRFPILSSLAEESRLAADVKLREPILVIVGNPPYSGHSANRGEWILKQIEAYKQLDGMPLGEKNPKWLQDDYVKFLRFAQWKIEQAGRGVVGMITNHAYLGNPTFRGMRRSLMQTFDEIYVLDLHGNSLRREVCPDGSKDENVFDIRQGVAIAFFVKTGAGGASSVRHAEVWGSREAKYAWLETNDVATTPWSAVRPRHELYLFVPGAEAGLSGYNSFVRVTDVFRQYSVGVVTARDQLTVRWTPDEVWATVRAFSQMDPELARQAYKLGRDAQDWRIALAQEDLRENGLSRARVVPIFYRPFDLRYTYYTGRSRGFICRPRAEVMGHMLAGDNVALVTPRRVEHVGAWRHAFVTRAISDHVAVSLKTIDYHFPLYLYPDIEKADLRLLEPEGRRPNLKPELLARLRQAYEEMPSPEQVFCYTYAVLYAPSYRERYAQLLRLDFPRIPFARRKDIFLALADLGHRLVALHLLASPNTDPPTARLEGEGEARVARNRREGFRYESASQRVYINPNQYFAPVPREVWEYCIGGYQVCEKWLKDRQGRRLSLEEIETYCRIVAALARTIELQEEIDELYARVEQDVLRMG
jgi:hypothetical protein